MKFIFQHSSYLLLLVSCSSVSMRMDEGHSQQGVCEQNVASASTVNQDLDIEGIDIKVSQLTKAIQTKFERDINEFDDITGFTPLQEAIVNNDIEGVKMLLLHSETNVNRRNENFHRKSTPQESPLVLAFLKLDLEMMRLVLEAGADPNQYYFRNIHTSADDDSGNESPNDYDIYARNSFEGSGLNFLIKKRGKLALFPLSQRQKVYNLLIKHNFDIGLSTSSVGTRRTIFNTLKAQGINP